MKAVIPVAGLGTRMLPATKAIPKEMLPVIDKPLIQYIVEEAVAAGVQEIVLVTHASKNSIENHFDKSFELESTLEKRVKRQLLVEIQNICPPDVTIMHVRQGEAKGLGHAIYKAYPCIGDSAFAVLLPDMLVSKYLCQPDTDNLAAMIARYEKTGHSQVMLERVPQEKVSQYGIASIKNNHITSGDFTEITNLVEKPAIEKAPSNLAIAGRYIFSKNIWPFLKTAKALNTQEIELTYAMSALLENEVMEGYQIKGRTYDCGSKRGYMRAILEYGLEHSCVSSEIRKIIAEHQQQPALA